jgi:hypothetical protein
MVGISASTAAYYNSLAGSGGGPDWIAGAVSAVKAASNPAGILGALAHSGNPGTLSSFLSSSKSFSNNFATIAQTNVTNHGSYYAQLAAANQKKAADARVTKAIEALQAVRQQVKPHNTLPSFMYLGNGTSLDTDNGILTKADGTQIDITTGAEIVDPANLIQLGNGSYLNTLTNILTLSDGTKIDNVTGLKVDTSA